MLAQKRKAYTDETLRSAIESINIGERNATQAARFYGIPRQTLVDKISNKHEGKYGGKTALSIEDENALVGYVLYMASIGNPLTVSDVKVFAWSIGKRSSNPTCFTENGPSEKWWRGFKTRHPRLTVRKPDKLDRRRKTMSTKSVINKHFALLRETLLKCDLLDKPSHIFNVDETGMEMDKSNRRIVVDRNSKHAYQESVGDREHITVNVCCSASGLILPPMIIFEKCFPSGNYSECGPDDCLYAKSPNGYMDGELFKNWFLTVFLPNTAHLRPAFLILDGHGSHLTIDVIDLAREHNVILYCLPPHTTHLLQPLDVAVFRSLKAYFSKLCGQVKLLTLGTSKVVNVSRKNFTAIFRVAFEACMGMQVIKNGFRKCGIYPFSPEAIDWSTVSSDDVVTVSAADSDKTVPTTSEDIPDAIKNNPLLQNNIIPRRLVDVFVIPHLQEVKKQNTRITTSSRVLTSDEHRNLVRNKLDSIQKAEEEKQDRRREREKKRAGKEKLKRKTLKDLPHPKRFTRYPRKDYSKLLEAATYITSSSSSGEEDDDTCATCHMEAPSGDADSINWICCDQCGKWYHEACEYPISNILGTYTCKRCQ